MEFIFSGWFSAPGLVSVRLNKSHFAWTTPISPPLSDILPSHHVGDYRAWLCSDNPEFPYDMIWIDQAGHSPRPHRVLPLGEPSLAIRRRFDSQGNVTNAELVVCSQYTIATWHRPQAFEELIALRLKPETSARYLGIDPIDFRDIPPQPVPHKLYQYFSDTLRAAESGADSSRVVRALTLELAKAMAEPRTLPRIAEAVRLLRKTDGLISVRSLAETTSLHARQLHRHFQQHLGVSPKFYARRLRLARAAILSDLSPNPEWADIAVRCGFHDQSHLINEYQQLINLTPMQSHQERLGLSDFSNSTIHA